MKTGSNGYNLNPNGTNGHSPSTNGKNGHKPQGRAKTPSGPARYAHIVGWGMEVPKHVVTNAELEAVVETTDEWIRSRTGIHERRIADERESVVTLGFEAARD